LRFSRRLSLKRITFVLPVLLALLLSARLHASTLFVANLDGAQEPDASTATGFGTVLLNDAMNQITVDLSFTGLIGGPATAAHIHCCALPGTNAGVLFPFSGVPSATSGSIPEQFFAITPLEVSELEAGVMYMNVHDATFPGGEIRGQLALATPEPASVAWICPALAIGLAVVSRRRKRTLA
jgi:hypothetical protein